MVDFVDFLNNPKMLTGTLARLFELEGRTGEAVVLKSADAQLEQTDYDNWNGGTCTYSLYLRVPLTLYAKLGKEHGGVEALILEKGCSILRPYTHDYLGAVLILPEIQAIEEVHEDAKFFISTEELIREVDAQRNLMIAVSTGGPKIATVNDEYRHRRGLIASGLQERHLQDSIPYKDLWEWYGKWSSGDLPSWSSRRQYIGELFAPLLDRLADGPSKRGADVFEEPTGWARVDRSIGEARVRLAEAESEEQYQAVGLLCRETLISLAEIVFDPAIHEAVDGIEPSESDAKRKLEAYLNTELRGETNKISRRHARAALDLANELAHKRTASFRLAALCAEATTTVVNIVAIISGKRDPK